MTSNKDQSAEARLAIALTRGRIAIVDEVDYDFLLQWRWYCTDRGRAARQQQCGGKRRMIYMHRVVADRMGIEGLADHINLDKLDNRRSNLRPCTKGQNNVNRRKQGQGPNGSRYIGVFRQNGRWAARTQWNGKRTWLGYFDDEAVAARAYDKAAKEQFGEFAQVNFAKEAKL